MSGRAGEGERTGVVAPKWEKEEGKRKRRALVFPLLPSQLAAFAATAASSLDHPLSSFEGSRRPENRDCCKK